MPATILFNGTIYTMDPALPRAWALGIRDGRVIAVGSEGKVQAAVGGRAEAINLRGRAVIPALTDAHIHLVWYALARHDVRLDGLDDYDEALRRIGGALDRVSVDGWVSGGGTSPTRRGGRR